MSNAYFYGLGLGLLLAVAAAVIVAVLERKSGVVGGRYDERQVAERGRAFRAGFFTALAALVLWACSSGAGIDLFDVPSGCALCLCIAILVYAGVAIFRDAYLRSGDRPGFHLILFFALAAINLYPGVRAIAKGSFLTDGRVTVENGCSVNFPVGVMLLAVAIMLLIKQLIDKRTERDDR